MHDIEPFYNWRHIYVAEEDSLSPFFGRTYSEFEFSQTVYNYYIHPQWDDFGSKTLYLKILFVEHEQHFAIIELLGEWNDAIENDIMELKREIMGKTCRHDSSRNSAGELRKGAKEITDPREAPGAIHPLIRTHPETHKNALFLGRRQSAYIIGMPLDESEDLLNRLWAHATQKEFEWYQVWKVGDLILWDNRSAMHRRDAFDANSRRLMHRTQIKGGKPYFDAAVT